MARLVRVQRGVGEGKAVQVPRAVRWQFKLETSQALRVTVRTAELFVEEVLKTAT